MSGIQIGRCCADKCLQDTRWEWQNLSDTCVQWGKRQLDLMKSQQGSNNLPYKAHLV